MTSSPRSWPPWSWRPWRPPSTGIYPLVVYVPPPSVALAVSVQVWSSLNG
ncbi:hypothetical protein ACFYXM_26380 [Streptomyces sp. NPDC002476]